MNIKLKCTTIVTVAVLASTNYSGSPLAKMKPKKAAVFAVENIVYNWPGKSGRALLKEIDWLMGEHKKVVFNTLLAAIMEISVTYLEPNLEINPADEFWFLTHTHISKLFDLIRHLAKSRREKTKPNLSDAEQRVIEEIPGLKYLAMLESFRNRVRRIIEKNQPQICTGCTIL